MKITISGTAEFAVKELANKARKLEKPTKMATLYMERETRLNFVKQSDPDGAAWAGLSPSTLAKKKSSAILRETGSLASSVASETGGLSGRVSVATDYGIYHQTGTSKMPQRKIIGISEGIHVPKILKIYQAHLGI